MWWFEVRDVKDKGQQECGPNEMRAEGGSLLDYLLLKEWFEKKKYPN